MVTQHIANPDDDPLSSRGIGNLLTLIQGLGDWFFEQNVIPGQDGHHAGFEMLVFGSGDQDGIRRPGLLEEAVIVRKTMLGSDSELVGQRFPTQRIGFHHADGLQPFGMTHGIFEVFVGPVSGTDGDDGHRAFQKGGFVHNLYVKQPCGRGGHPNAGALLTAGFRVL